MAKFVLRLWMILLFGNVPQQQVAGCRLAEVAETGSHLAPHPLDRRVRKAGENIECYTFPPSSRKYSVVSSEILGPTRVSPDLGTGSFLLHFMMSPSVAKWAKISRNGPLMQFQTVCHLCPFPLARILIAKSSYLSKSEVELVQKVESIHSKDCSCFCNIRFVHFTFSDNLL